MAEYLRLIRRTHLQTSIHYYAHPGTGRRVTVIGTHHVGERAYFAGLRVVIDELEAAGALVHCEGSRLLPCDDPDITAEEQQLLAELRRCDELEKRRLAHLGWVGQIDGLGYPPHWQVIDLSYLEILRRLGVTAIQRLVHGKTKAFDWPNDDRKGIDRLRLRIAATLHATANDRHVTQLNDREPTKTVLLGDRTTVALNGVAGTDRDTVLVWGVAHMPGLGAGLREQGFVRSDEPQWHTVAELPSMRTALWRVVNPALRGGRAARGGAMP